MFQKVTQGLTGETAETESLYVGRCYGLSFGSKTKQNKTKMNSSYFLKQKIKLLFLLILLVLSPRSPSCSVEKSRQYPCQKFGFATIRWIGKENKTNRRRESFASTVTPVDCGRGRSPEQVAGTERPETQLSERWLRPKEEPTM